MAKPQVLITALYDNTVKGAGVSKQKSVEVTLADSSVVTIKVGESAIVDVPNGSGPTKVEQASA